MEDIVKEWYVVNTYAGHENRVKENLERRVETMGIENNLFRILVAEEPEIEIKNGKKVERMRNLFPGYLFVEMIMTDEAWYVVRNTRGVTGFVGPGSKPVPLTEVEMRSMGIKVPTMEIDMEIGDMIKIIAGAWEGTVGTVKTISTHKQAVTIDVEMFGQATSVEIGFTDIQKLD
jgi:transcriptional antiterminator NusG